MQQKVRYFIGKRYEEEKIVDEFKGNVHSGQNVPNERTSEKIAKQNNTNERTVRRNANYSKAIDEIKKHQPEVAEKMCVILRRSIY